MKHIRFLCTVFFMAPVALPACAQTACDTLYLSVEELLSKVSRSNLQVAADRLKEQMAAERARAARKAQLPSVNVGLRAGYLGQPIVWESGLSHATRPDSPDWQQNYSIDISQPIYQGGRIKYAIRKADLEQELARLQTAADEGDIRLAMLSHYLELFSMYKQHIVLSRKIEESERRLKDIRKLKSEGIITNNDVLRSELQLTDDRLALQETDNDIRIASQQMDILLGLDENLLLVPDTALLADERHVDSYEQYVERASLADPSVLALHKQTEIAENNVSIKQSAFRPSISLTASNTLARPVSRTMADMYNNAWNVGVSVSYPLSALYTERHQLREARQNVMLMRNAEEQKQQQIRMAVQAALLRHREAIDRVEALKLSVRQAAENYRIMYNRYMNQLAILTDLLDADNLRLNAELQLTTARTQVAYTYYELQRAVGEL